jgi:O-acetyl-ADP-ribose deacetylase (regulator of RNase III)
MIHLTRGDLLKADVDALVNTVNTVGVMGKGVALQFRQAFPRNYEAYRRACEQDSVKLGRMFVFDAGQLVRPRYIINFPTKKHWKSKSRLEDIEAGLVDLVRVIEELDIKSIAVPPLGAGSGGLNWSDVRPRIEKALGGLSDVDVLLYVPEGAPPASEMKVATNKPRMTPGRAALLGLLKRYVEPGLDVEPGLGASPLEIQKLLYLLQVAGERLRLNFAASHYGPYAENVNHVLRALEGHYIRGYGDRSRPVSESAPIELVPGAAEEADDFLNTSPDTLRRFRRVIKLIDGFESPYGLELLATVHWVATQVDRAARTDADLAVRLVQAWSRRKQRLFTERHIKIAWERLKGERWLDPESLELPMDTEQVS